MITLHEVQLRRGGKLLLDGAHLSVHPEQHVGLVGANGCGKSSVFKLLLGELSADAGNVSIPAGWRIAHMAQEVAVSDRSSLDFVLDGDAQLRETEREVRAAEEAGDHLRHARALEKMDSIRGFDAPYRAEQLMHGLGFHQHAMQVPVTDFSGGWRIRLNLAQALMSPCELLLLDEPTNHLDLDAALWLEQWLRNFAGATLIISHDRDFLDNVVQRIAHIEHHTCETYTGGYTSFERVRGERLALQQANYEKQQCQRQDVEGFVARFRYKASKARQAQSRLKALERMQESAPAHVSSPFFFRFPEPKQVHTALLRLHQADIGYGNSPVLTGVNLEIQPGIRMGLLGANGAGKSTLINGLTGKIPLLDGTLTVAKGLSLGYFSQHQLEALDLDASALLHLQRLTPKVPEQQIRNFLGGFNFHGDGALQPIKSFSGGEKARIALAIIVWLKPNLLLLDEPTNHLDLDMRYALTLALQHYEGALLVISHDRHLLRNTVDELYLVNNGQFGAFDGDLSDYEQHMREINNPTRETATSPNSGKRALRQQSAAQRSARAPLARKIQALEKQLEITDQKLRDVQSRLAEPSIYTPPQADELLRLVQVEGRLKSDQRQAEDTWLTLQGELEKMA